MKNTHEKEELMKLFSVCASSQLQLREQLLASLQSFFNKGVVRTKQSHQSLAKLFQQSDLPEQPVSVQTYIDHLVENIIPYSINMRSPRCLGHMTSVLPNIVGPLNEVLMALNQNLVKYEASRTFTLLERQTLAMMHRLIYDHSESFYDEHAQNESSALGIMASGGTLANITALWIARNSCLGRSNGFPGVEEAGLQAALDHFGYAGAVVIGSSLMHYSIEKAASLLGIGLQNLIKIPLDNRNRADVDALRRTVEECLSRRLCIISLVGVAGTTDSGSIDPLLEIAQVARETKTYFHVDAAWGAPLLFSRRHREKLSGIEYADSVTADGHKLMYLPIGSSMLLLRSPCAADLVEKQTSYVLHEDSGDLGKRSLEGSRDGKVLFVHAALNIIGRPGYELLVDENIDKAKMMADIIRRRPEFELLFEPETNILLYRYIPLSFRQKLKQGVLSGTENETINRCNKSIQKSQSLAGHTFVARTILNSTSHGVDVPITALRAVIGNPFTGIEDIEEILEDQCQIAASFC